MTLTTLHKANGVDLPVERLTMPYGMTVEEMAVATHAHLDGLTAWVRAPEGAGQDWIELPRHMWRHVRPKASDAVLYRYRLNDFVRDLFAVAAAVLISVAVPFLAPVLGSVGAALAGAALGIGAQLALNALFPAQQSAIQALNSPPAERARQFANVDSDSNLLAKESYLPVVAGLRRIAPPEIAYPHFFLDNGQQAVHRLFALDGRHQIADVQIDKTPVTDFPAIETLIRDGDETTTVQTFITKVTKPTSVGEALVTFTLDSTALVDQETPSNSEPTPVRFQTASDTKLEEISIRLQIDSFIKSDSAATGVRVPLRIRFRPKGSEGAWFYLPEIHLVGRDVSTALKEIRIRWDDQFGEDGAGGAIQYEFFQRVPPATYILSDGSTGDQWQADAHFVMGSGLRDVQNIVGRRNAIRVTLDPATYPKQEYEWEIVRGLAMLQSGLTTSTYAYAGVIQSFFRAHDNGAVWRVPVDQGAYVGRITVSQATVIVNRQPCQRPKVALLALKAKGQNVRNVTALCGRYVMDWDGDAWADPVVTANPATHYRQVLYDYLVHHGINTGLIINQQFVDWRQECIDQGYEVSAVHAGASTREVLDAYATAGFARSRFSDGFGVDWFRDRSGDLPVMAFSPRNASVSVEWVMGERPIGIRGKFQNEDRGYVDDEIQVNNPFYTNFSGYEVRSYDSISNALLVERRALFDMLQAHYQGRRAWIVETSIEGLVCDRGDLVSIVTDLLDDAHSGARIRTVYDTTTFSYDQEIPSESTESLFDVDNIFDPVDIFTVGEQSVVIVTTPTGTEMRTIVAAEQQPEGWLIRVDEPFSSTDLAGAHFVIGPVSRFTHRCIVSDVTRLAEERARLVLVDEAPEIYSTLLERFG
jgi:hypothetical protein